MSESAREVYKGICGFLDSKGGDYSRDDGSLSVTMKVDCDGAVCPIFIQADATFERVSVIAVLPVSVNKENGEDILKCVTWIHRELGKGAFCMYIDEERLTYESTDTFAGLGGIGEGFAESIIGSAVGALKSYAATIVAAAEGKSE